MATSFVGDELFIEKLNVDDLYALIKDLKLKKVKILYHSMDTLAGMEFTKQHPEFVLNLALTGTIIPKSDSLESVFSECYEKQANFLLNRSEVAGLIKLFKDKGVNSLKSVFMKKII